MTVILSFQECGLGKDALHDAFLDAFSDYIVPSRPERDAFETMLHARSFDAAATRVVKTGDRITAFWLVGRRAAHGYLIASGTRPEARAKGLGQSLGQEVLAALRDSACRQMQLEVISDNRAALGLYRKLGFQTGRKLDCYRLSLLEHDRHSCELTDWDGVRARLIRDQLYPPSWQNAHETLAASPAALVGIRHGQGAAVLSPQGLLHQIAAQGQNRRAALTELIAAASAQVTGPLSLINVDARDRDLSDALADLGADPFLSQWELIRPL